MSLFGEDPKDATIKAQEREIEFLRGQVVQLQEKFLALASPASYRVSHRVPEGDRPRTLSVPANVAFRRGVPFKPSRDREDQKNQGAVPNENIHDQFRSEPAKVGA